MIEIINEEVRGSDDDIKTIILTRNGETLFKNIDPKSIDSLTFDTKNTLKGNDINFNFFNNGIYQWTPEQQNDVNHFLYNVLSDDGQVQGIYNSSKKLYGPPFFDCSVGLYLDESIEGSAFWIPHIIYYYGDHFIGPLGGEEGDWCGNLYLNNWREDPNEQDDFIDDDRSVLAKAMQYLFWGPFFSYRHQFSDGLSNSGGTWIMSHFSNAYPDYVELWHGERSDLNENRPGFIYYDNYNCHAISTRRYNFYDERLCSNLAEYRYQMANMAWFKLYMSSVDDDFYQEFNKMLYNYGCSFLGGYGYLYEQPIFAELVKMAEKAWELDGNTSGPEGYETFEEWRKEQYILVEQRRRNRIAQFGLFCDDKNFVVRYIFLFMIMEITEKTLPLMTSL